MSYLDELTTEIRDGEKVFVLTEDEIVSLIGNVATETKQVIKKKIINLFEEDDNEQ